MWIALGASLPVVVGVLLAYEALGVAFDRWDSAVLRQVAGCGHRGNGRWAPSCCCWARPDVLSGRQSQRPGGGVVLGVAVPVVAFRFFAPNEVFPVTYRRAKAAYLDVGGRRGEAIRTGVQEQLGLRVLDVQPVGLEDSAGSSRRSPHWSASSPAAPCCG